MISKSQKLIVQFLTKQISLDQQKTLFKWLKKEKNEKEFINYVKLNYAIDFNLRKFDTAKSKMELLKHIRSECRIRPLRQLRILSKYAALMVLFFGIGYLYTNDHFSIAPEPLVLQILLRFN
jgi:transmembrane sensor